MAGAASAARIAILADDLIWGSRLAAAVRRSGGAPQPVRTGADLPAALAGAAGCMVDLTSRAYDGIAALEAARAAGVPAIAVGQHDDVAQRRAARAAGAERVFAYRALHEHADRELGPWIARLSAASPPGQAADDAGGRG